MTSPEANQAIRYEPDESCPPLIALGVGLQGVMLVLATNRRAYAALFAGPEARYIKRRGQMVPDPPGLAEHQPQTGQTLDSFGDVFPLVWSPGDWN